ncbi:alpha/beta fold hydrolase [Dongshaea marina]|uniref:alpha/beta fold hydrolase n=1 Tax=Dongshaea marina TaxID=2047966 RepID=UPI000D3E03AA|nr:alpha/beta fold hydrolase [Dongshaea marina]
MQTFTIEHRKMRYLDLGQGPVIVFGHSYLWDSAMWEPQLELLSQHYRCIVPDLWAHGQSDIAPEKTRSLSDYADNILALLDHLKVEEFSVVGLSVGGMWGAELALKAPGRMKSLTMMDTFIGLEPEVTHQKYFGMLDAIAGAKAIPEPLLDIITPMFFAKDAIDTNPDLVADFRHHLASLKGERVVEVTRIGRMIFGRRDLMDEAAKLTMPVLIMTGAQDMPRPPLESQLMHDAIAGSEYVLVPHAGHISNLEQAQFVTDELMTFLGKIYA